MIYKLKDISITMKKRTKFVETIFENLNPIDRSVNKSFLYALAMRKYQRALYTPQIRIYLAHGFMTPIVPHHTHLLKTNNRIDSKNLQILGTNESRTISVRATAMVNVTFKMWILRNQLSLSMIDAMYAIVGTRKTKIKTQRRGCKNKYKHIKIQAVCCLRVVVWHFCCFNINQFCFFLCFRYLLTQCEHVRGNKLHGIIQKFYGNKKW